MMDTVFFWLSKLIWLVISPDFLLVFSALAGMLFWFAGKVKRARWILSGVVLAMSVITVFPLGMMLLAPLEQRFPANPELPEKVDGVIMLGGAEISKLSRLWHQPELNASADRYVGFIRLVRAYPDAVHLFTGGSGDPTGQEWKCTDTARPVFEALGLDTASFLFEEKSRNTYENGLFSKNLAHPEPGQVWVLVTSAAHMPRSVGVFNQLGWPVIPYPVDHFTPPDREIEPGLNFSGNLRILAMAAREWTGLAAYYITGKTNALFPSKKAEGGGK